jgi:putative sigma-54 modulation protein
MPIETTPVKTEITFRHMEGTEAIREYILKRLSKVIHSLPNLRSASVEVGFEHTRPADKRYVVQVTLASDGTLLRVEDRGPDATSTTDSVHDLLQRRIRDWRGRVYFERRREVSAYKEEVGLKATALPPEDKTGLIVRVKRYEIRPMFPEDAVEQMELLGHDFFFFLNAETGQHNVVYRRKAGGYGLIEPIAREVTTPVATESADKR